MTSSRKSTQRRQFLKSLMAAGISIPLINTPLFAKSKTVIKKAIPSTGELLPVIGLGTSRTFNIPDHTEAIQKLLPVMQAFLDRGGTLIDSSPMYGAAEEVIGVLFNKARQNNTLFSATKVWTDGKSEGIAQMQHSMKLWGVNKFDLMQIHNLRDWEVHLDTLRQWKADGKIRYIGITTSHGRFHDELEKILQTRHEFDFVQFSYNLANRDVEARLLPIAKEKGIATLINRPFQKGGMFSKVKGKPLPTWASEIDCNSWGQYFLKFVVSHPAVTCAIPATSRQHHMVDNMGAGLGNLPDAKQRQRMITYFDSL